MESFIRQQQASATPQWLRQFQAYQQKKWSPTKLSLMDEQRFKKWITGLSWFNDIKRQVADENNVSPDKIDNNRLFDMVAGPDADYDYRGAWKGGARPSRDKFDDGRMHWPSSLKDKNLKSPKHPTVWKEFFMREHKANPDALGLGDINSALEWQKSKPQSRKK